MERRKPFKWTNERKEYLEKNWGKRSPAQIARKYGVPVTCISRKAHKMGLPKIIEIDRVPLYHLIKLFGSSYYRIHSWVDRGMPCRKMKCSSVRTFYLFDLKEVVDWLEGYQSEFDATKINLTELSYTPKWLLSKVVSDTANKDHLDSRLQWIPWTDGERNKLKMLKSLGYTYPQISKKMHKRTTKAVRYEYERIVREGEL